MTSPIYPAGTTPSGFLVPLNYALPGKPYGVLADAIDPTTGEFMSIVQGFDPDDAWVLAQLSIDRGTGAAVVDDGRDFSEVSHVSARHASVLQQEILRPLKRLVDQKVIQVVSLKIDELESADGYEATLVYRKPGRPDQRTVRVKGAGTISIEEAA